MRRKSNKIDPRNKTIVRALLLLNATLWFAYTIYIYFDMAIVNHNGLAADIAAIYVFANAVAMFASGLALGKQQKPSFYLALIVVILNIVLTMLNLTDIVFVVAFILDIIILWLLMSIRNAYLLNS